LVVNNKKGDKTPFFSYTGGCRGKGLWEYIHNTITYLYVNEWVCNITMD